MASYMMDSRTSSMPGTIDSHSHLSTSSIDGSVAALNVAEKSTPDAITAPSAGPPSGPPGKPPPPPDGGFAAWIQVAGSFFLILNCWGIVNTFGVFQTYYETELLTHKTPSDISWIGSLEAFLLLTVSVLAGPLYDLGYLRALIAAGSFLMVFGFMMLSLCTEYWQIMLTQGLITGAGSGLLFLPSVAIIPQYFAKHKAVATGIAMSGSGLGGIIYPIIFRELQPKIGFGWAVRVIAFIMLATLMVPVLGMRLRTNSPGVRKMFEAEAWKDIPYTLLGLGAFFGFAGLYIPMFYIQSYALNFQIADATLAFYILPILNGASIFGRILPNFITDKVGVFNVFTPTALFVSILAFAWIGIKSTGGLIVFAVLYGFFSGTFLSLAPMAAVVLIIPNMQRIGVRMGMNFFVGALGLLIGTPVAGAILKSSWAGMQAFSGATLAVCALFFFGVKVTKRGWNMMDKI